MTKQNSHSKLRISIAGRPDHVADMEAAGVVVAGDVVAAHIEGRDRAEYCLSTLRHFPCGDELLADACMVSTESRTRRAFLTGFLIRIKQHIAVEVPA